MPAADLGAVSTALHTAAKAGDAAATQRLLDSGAAVDARDEWHRTPLHAAAACGHTDIVKVLLSAGAAVDAVRTGGWTALQLAAGSGKAQVVQLLLAAGADASAEQQGSGSALARAAEYAVRTGDTASVDVFLQHYSSVVAPPGALLAAALEAASTRSSYPGAQKDVVSRLLQLLSIQQAADTCSPKMNLQHLLCQLRQHPRHCLQLVTEVLLEAWLQQQHAAAETDLGHACHNQLRVQDMLVSAVTAMQSS